ncbi:MAG TPA: PQQ-binding-like beta-propeller repeat protein [Vicinamibacterales bacterium]|nr:PQQ-binding-like beta-propeller repeat protein [Vicinamibacterales bacterium]
MRTTIALAALLLSIAVLPSHRARAQAADWFQWRGPNRDGHSEETGLLKQWPPGGPRLVWKTSGAGTGYSSLSASNGRLYTLGARDVEYAMAFDAATGRKLWETPLGRRYRNDQGDGPRSTPTVDGDRLYVFGGSGDLASLDAATGKRIWSVNVVQTFGGATPPWGYSESPLIISDRIVLNAGGRRASIVAINKTDGTTLWQNQGDEAAYSSPMLLRTGSLAQVVFFTSRRALAVDPRDGRLLWSYDRVANNTANIATPIVRGTRVFFSSDYGTGAALLDVKASGNIASASEVYFTREMRNHHASSVVVGDNIYGFSSSILTALKFDTGDRLWRDRSVGKGSLIYGDERLYLYSEDGTVGLADASADAYHERGRFSIQPSTGAPTWAHPIITNGKFILRDQDVIYAYDVKAR